MTWYQIELQTIVGEIVYLLVDISCHISLVSFNTPVLFVVVNNQQVPQY